MNTEAREIVASYLTGNRVSHEELERACNIINAEDRAYADYLRREVGLSSDWTNTCDVFLEHVDTFCEMSRDERQREMPSLVRHAEECASCRGVYWDVKGFWQPSALIAEAKTVVRQMAETLRLGVDAAGLLLERGLTPVPVLRLGVAGVQLDAEKTVDGRGFLMEEQEEAVAGLRQKEWVLDDEENNCSVRLKIEGLPEGGVQIWASLEASAGSLVQVAGARITVRALESGSVWVQAPLEKYSPSGPPLVLPGGRWTISVHAVGGDGNVEWRIPLDAEAVP